MSETYKDATSRLLSELAALGWEVKANLKVPHATLGDVKLWFRPQAVYVSPASLPMNSAHSTFYDFRDSSAQELLAEVERF